MDIMRKINRFVFRLQDHVLHVVPIVSVENYILDVPLSKCGQDTDYSDVICDISQTFQTSKVILN
jgi:hypothetical protein